MFLQSLVLYTRHVNAGEILFGAVVSSYDCSHIGVGGYNFFEVILIGKYHDLVVTVGRETNGAGLVSLRFSPPLIYLERLLAWSYCSCEFFVLRYLREEVRI